MRHGGLVLSHIVHINRYYRVRLCNFRGPLARDLLSVFNFFLVVTFLDSLWTWFLLLLWVIVLFNFDGIFAIIATNDTLSEWGIFPSQYQSFIRRATIPAVSVERLFPARVNFHAYLFKLIQLFLGLIMFTILLKYKLPLGTSLLRRAHTLVVT